MNDERIYVRCSCGWEGKRDHPLGRCPECEEPLRDSRDPYRGRRIKWALSVLPETREALEPREAAEILDRAARRRRA